MTRPQFNYYRPRVQRSIAQCFWPFASALKNYDLWAYGCSYCLDRPEVPYGLCE